MSHAPKAVDPESIAASRILVVAPHPDDETLGCGGLMAALAAKGRWFHTLFVTDGGASHRASPSWPRARLAAQRQAEATEALARLGLADHPRTFLGLPDAGMPPAGSVGWEQSMARVRRLLADFQPDLVLLPWRRDPHRDHRDSWLLVSAACEAESLRVDSLEYAIWLDELGSEEDQPQPGEMAPVTFDISAGIAAKRHAIAAHRSQTTGLIDDDPAGFRLTDETIARLTGPTEKFLRPCGR
ncbi:PIG-L deacetylase family protein [Jiella marina]|uniref:PIG-L deacetylase family protein n=1 Tax=Jiella sp. LLJ827 TaxID=2917712 RepID=UPI002100CB0C|nr:PIG-L deacetylase family protein [Jiella sp. LLJ827]MCQ0988998.1 PIG-L family deacetylase [Jiella sp. LLJ827]